MSKKGRNAIYVPCKKAEKDLESELLPNRIGQEEQVDPKPITSKKAIIFQYLKKFYHIIEVVYTLSFFSFLLYFVIGCFVHDNQSDNDLIMKQIKEEITEEGEITSIIVDDVHGFGNISIIATTRTLDYDKDAETNKLIILDLVENKVLNSLHDPFGLKSSYKTTFSYSIDVEGAVPDPVIEYVLDIVGDSTKEIMVRYYYWGSTYGAYGPAIFKYSYEAMEYQLIGTYPMCEKLDLATYTEDGSISGFSTEIIETPFFNSDEDFSMLQVMECTRENTYFNLSDYSMTLSRSYWATGDFGTVLVVLQLDQEAPQDYWQRKSSDYYVNIYQPMYNSEEDMIKWNAIFSEYCDESVDIWNQDSIESFICKKFNHEIKILTPEEQQG